MQSLVRTTWGGVVPMRTGETAEEAIRSWARARGLNRLLLIRDGSAEAIADRDALVTRIEAAGLAVFPVDHRGGRSAASVAEAVGAFHFDHCQAVVACGGADAVELAKLTALMTGQRRPLVELAGDRDAIDPRLAAPFLAVAEDLEAIAALAGATIFIDDRGCPVLLRDGALRPQRAAYCPTPEGDDRSSAVAALVLDAVNASDDPGPGVTGLVDALAGESVDDRVRAAVQAAGLIEAGPGPACVFSVYAETVGDIPRHGSLAALVGGYGALGVEVAARLGGAEMARAALQTLPLDPLAHIDRAILPVDISPVLTMLGRNIPAPRRRGGRGGVARGRRTE